MLVKCIVNMPVGMLLAGKYDTNGLLLQNVVVYIAKDLMDGRDNPLKDLL